MRKFAIALFVVALVAGAVAAKAYEGDAKKPVTNKRCPVMPSDSIEKFRTEYKGQYVYFCCQGCIAAFEKDPETYVAKMSNEDQEAIKVNELCPMTKETITDRSRWVEDEGRKVYFCCDGCADGYKQKMAEKKPH